MMLTITVMIIIILRVILRGNTSRPTLPQAMAVFRPGADRQQTAVCQQPGSVPAGTQFALSVSLLLSFVIQCAPAFFVQTVFCTRDHCSPEDFMKLFTAFRWLLLTHQRPFPQFFSYTKQFINQFTGILLFSHKHLVAGIILCSLPHLLKCEVFTQLREKERLVLIQRTGQGALCSLPFLSHKMPPGAFQQVMGF